MAWNEGHAAQPQVTLAKVSSFARLLESCRQAPCPLELPAHRRGGPAHRPKGKTIRYHRDLGPLQPKARSPSGTRLFVEETLAELTIIRALLAMDVARSELSRILEVRRAGVGNSGSW